MQKYKIDALDQLRFFAATLVVLTHFRLAPDLLVGTHGLEKAIKAWVQHGSWGVSIFLVLSAFLFTKNFIERGQEAYWPFMRKRLLRILPMYCLVGILLMTQNRAEWSVSDLLRFLTFQVNTGNPMTGFGHEHLPIGPIWTIGVEFQFYLLFPLLFAAFDPTKRGNVLRLTGIVLLMIALRLLLSLWTLGPAAYYNSYHTLLGRFDQFVIGILAAAFFVRYQSKLTWRHGLYMLLTTLVVATLYLRGFNPMSWPKNTYSFTLEAVIAASLIISFTLVGGVPGRAGKALAYLGAASYSIYLLHLPIGTILTSQYGGAAQALGGPWLQLVALVLIPTVVVSLVTYHCIEKPFMDLARTRFSANGG